jgi:uncharacterized protein YegP (UPF0339 family)
MPPIYSDPNPEVVPHPRFEVYEDAVGSYRWRLVAQNGQIVASSGEDFYSRNNAIRAIHDLTALPVFTDTPPIAYL